MAQKNQSERLTAQHNESHGVVGMFGEEAKLHDMTVGVISHHIIRQLAEDFPQLVFRYRSSIEKKEINEALKKIDPELGQTLFVVSIRLFLTEVLLWKQELLKLSSELKA